MSTAETNSPLRNRPRTLFHFEPHRLLALLALLLLSPLAMLAQTPSQETAKCPPPTRKDDVVDTLHDVKVPDPYRWLEDQNSPETRAWIDAQDKCTDAYLKRASDREAISKRLTELMKVDEFSLPIERGGKYFFSKRNKDQDLFVIYMRAGLNGAEQVLIDPHGLSPDHSTSVGPMDVSKDGKFIAYGIRLGGADEVTPHFMDTDSRKDLPDQLPKANYFGLSIASNDKDVYYSRTTADGPRVFHHVMGADPASDPIIFGDGYKSDKIVASDLSEDGRYLTIQVIYGSGSTRSEIYVKDLQSDSPVKPIQNDLDNLFFGEIQGGALYLRTNWNAPHWAIYRVDLDRPTRDQWKQIVPESDASIEDVSLAGGKLLVRYVQNAVSHLKMFDTDGTPSGELALPATGSIDGVSGHWSSPEIFVEFNSFSIPLSIYHYDLRKNQLDVWVAPKVPIDSANYVTDQIWYPSKDGTKIPMFLFYKKGLAKNGTNATLLTGYGGFDVSSTPEYRAQAVTWADRGGVFALANLRGGGEFGEAWHHAGMMEKKQNVFDDFIAAAEWLIENKYTDKNELAIEGGSNGGLLVGAAETQRPDLFRAVVCSYPLLDMLRYQLFEEGPYWVPEYGSADNPEQFKYLLAYSPYQNVKEGTKYPATLFVTGDGDTRVAPLHARKMAARLQAATSSDEPILILYDTKSGHSGGRPLNKQIEENTDILSFLTMQVGQQPAQQSAQPAQQK